MKATQTCPKCSGKKFVVTETFHLPENRFRGATQVVPVITVGPEYGPRTTLGTFETWVCWECGYTEFYAHALKGIRELAAEHPDQVRVVDAGHGEQGPHR